MADLVWSIKNGDLEQVKDQIEKENTNINSNINGRYLLHYAADFGQYEVMEYLLQAGAHVNELDKHGITPLLAAIWEGHTKCVQLLLAKGALKNGTTPDGRPYLEVAEKDDIRILLS